MAVRVKLRIKRNSKIVDTVALVNSGFETPTPQLLVPIPIAELLEFWPPKENALVLEYDTAGGPLQVWVYMNAVEVSVIVEDLPEKYVKSDLVVSPIADEVLISDMLASALEIAVEDFGKGLWRFRWEPKDKLRKSEKPLRYRK